MADRRRRASAPSTKGSRTAHRHKVTKRPDGETAERAELRMMRELVVVLVQTISDLFNCLPKDVHKIEQVARVNAALAKLLGTLDKTRQRWASDDHVGL
jgi:hypothetical protein